MVSSHRVMTTVLEIAFKTSLAHQTKTAHPGTNNITDFFWTDFVAKNFFAPLNAFWNEVACKLD